MSELLDAALGYAFAGYKVHPCRPSDKRPLTNWGREATTIPGVIEARWKTWPDALVAVCTGNGLVVVDDDRGLAEPDPDLADTLTARTRSRGYHHWFWMPDSSIGCHVGILPGIDIRGEGGYVIAPPSPGWEFINDVPRLLLPKYISDALNARRTQRRSNGFEPAEAGSIGPGERHWYMVRFAGWWIRAFESEDLPDLQAACLEEYRRACSPADAPDRNIRKIARSILTAHQRNAA